MNTFELLAYPLIPISALELLLGFLLLRQRPRSSRINKSVAAIAFFSSAFTLNTSVMYLVASRGHDFNLFARMNWIGWFIIPSALQFTYYLQDENSRKARLVGFALYPYWVAMLLLALFTDLIVTPSYTLIPYSNHPGPLEVPARLSGSAMIGWLMYEIVRVRKRLTGIKKVQLDYFFAGALIFAFAGGMIAGILQVFGGFGLEPGLGSYFSLPWVVLTFYAIVRHSLFEARIIVSRTLNVILLVLLFSGIQVGLHRALLPVFGTEPAILVSLSLLGFVLFGTPLSSKLQGMINVLVIGNRYGYQSRLREAMHALISMDNVPELPARFVDIVRSTIGVEHAGLYLHRSGQGHVMRYGTGSFAAMTNVRSLAPMIADHLLTTKQSLVRNELEVVSRDEAYTILLTYLRGIGAAVIIPLFYQGRLEGALALGEKGTGEKYGQSDIELLETIAGQVVVAIENDRLLRLAEQVRAALQESDRRFHDFTRTIPVAIFINQGEQIKYANVAAQRLSGYSLDELASRSFWDLIHPAYRSAVQNAMVEHQDATRQLPTEEFKIINRHKEERWVVLATGVIDYGERPALIWTMFDITEQKHAEGERNYHRRIAALSRLATGLACDFNSIMREIARAGTFLREHLDAEDPLRVQADQVLTSTERAAWLTRSLLDFGNRDGAKRAMHDLNAVLRGAERQLAGMLSGNIGLSIMPGAEPLKINMDANRIEHVLINLVVNARDAMPDGGSVTVKTGTTAIDSAFILKQGYGKAGVYAFLSVADTGIGMDDDLQGRIFEPFFTTKTDLKATGFGLSLSYDIVKDHGGYLTVQSAPGKGSVFTVYLPLVQTEGITDARSSFLRRL